MDFVEMEFYESLWIVLSQTINILTKLQSN